MMEKQLRGDSSTLRFWHRSDKANKDGFALVHLVYQLHSNKRCFSITGTLVLPINWDRDQQKFIFAGKDVAKKFVQSKGIKIDYSTLPSKEEIKALNLKLAKIEADVKQIEGRYRSFNKPFDCDDIINDLKELQKPLSQRIHSESNVIDFIDKFREEKKNVKKPGTLKEYKSLQNHISDFTRLHNVKFNFEKLSIAIMNRFNDYLSSTGMNNITKAKMISTLKTLLRRAEDEYDIKINHKCLRYKNPHPRYDKELQVIALTEEEFQALIDLDVSNKKNLDEAKDIFLFSCQSGLRYSDLVQLKWEHIKKDGFIKMNSEKTGKLIEIPITPIMIRILQKYHNRISPLPTNSNGKLISDSKLNKNIKNIGRMASIDEKVEIVSYCGTKKKIELKPKFEVLSIHKGRKTGITLNLEKGVPIEVVKEWSGHASFKAMNPYIKITKERKRTAIAQAWGSVNPLKKAN